METVKELKIKILEKISQEEFDELIEQKLQLSPVILGKNKRMLYHIIADGLKIKLSGATASSSKEAFPVKIGELLDNEKTNFNLTGYVVDPLRIIINKSNNEMGFMTIADDTGIMSLTIWSDALNPILDLELKVGDFVKGANLYWKDKTDGYNPSVSKYASITKVEPDFAFADIVTHSIGQLTDGKYFTIKGIIGNVPESGLREVYHCEKGHWFKNLEDKDVGTQSLCEHDNCGVPMYVEKHINAQGVIFADLEGTVEVDISVFAELDSLKIMDEYILNGKYEDSKFKVTSATSTKKE